MFTSAKWAKEFALASGMKLTRCRACGAPILEDKGRFVDVYDSIPYTSKAASGYLRATGLHPAKIIPLKSGFKRVVDAWNPNSITPDGEYLLLHDCGRLCAYLERERRRAARRKSAIQPALIA